MAPILKELETPAPAANATSPATPHAKPSNEATARIQPVALEIPVTVNGARTVDGSDKRVPFSETTQTVLVLPHGAVIRTSTQLTSGQLVFLTNEKTKKEIVCQVVKSKSTGSAGAYVELQFTEPSPGFWGLQLPAAAAPTAPRPVAPAAPVVPKPAAPAAPVAAKPVAPAAKPVAPAAPPAPPLKPTVPTVSLAVHTAPVSSRPEPAAPVIPVPPVSVAPPPPPAAVPPVPTQPESVTQAPAEATSPVGATSKLSVPEMPVDPPPMASVEPDVQAAQHPATPAPTPRDFLKEIDALFCGPQTPAAPAAPESRPAPASAEPSSEELKQRAAHLQAQLGSLLFTEPPAPSAAPVAHKPETPVEEVAKKVLQFTQDEAKLVVPSERKPASPARTSAATTLGADEEVKIPSWLAPLSQNSGSTADATSAEASVENSVSVNSEESFDALATQESHRPEAAVFGGQLLGESAVSTTESSGGSKKGLLLGLVAATLVIVGGSWYFFQNHATSNALAVGSRTVASNELAPASNAAAPEAPAPARNNATAASSQPSSKKTAPTPAPEAAVPQPKNAKPAAKEPEPEEAPAKPSLGDVHLGAPVVNRQAESAPDPDALQSIDTKTVPGGEDAFAATAAGRAGPAAPLPVGGDVKQAQLLKSVPPDYPAMAKSQHVSGRVLIDALIDASGNVAGVKVIAGPALLHRAALDAVKQWKYSPAMLDGQPTSMHLTVTVDFKNQ